MRYHLEKSLKSDSKIFVFNEKVSANTNIFYCCLSRSICCISDFYCARCLSGVEIASLRSIIYNCVTPCFGRTVADSRVPNEVKSFFELDWCR